MVDEFENFGSMVEEFESVFEIFGSMVEVFRSAFEIVVYEVVG